MPNEETTTALRDLIAHSVGRHWDAWAQDHPHLARAVDRTHLIRTTVARLRDDPAFIEAMTRAGLDEATLRELERVVSLIDQAVWRVL